MMGICPNCETTDEHEIIKFDQFHKLMTLRCDYCGERWDENLPREHMHDE